MNNPNIVTVLVALAVFVVIIGLFVFINRKSKSSTSDTNRLTGNPADTSGKTGKSSSNLPEDDALVAVLTAAVLASMGNRPDVKIRVTSFRRIPETSPIWNTVGRKEYISNKL
ncbi:OadG family transporter subunit [Acetivibrio straminisolvens]|jgi:uncharacterized membrane protein|uniref:Oxaloacetate decarboxylase gamma chain n=1 Tax=Acetivibrio straminisolvens JCM 21531 TaxID=1294263 RepID=W4V7F6_9FIRM|nr:OadG family transporter subunit [Acetivibrio straminisolvens]GAE89147.1 hypothetical protein JCM21531_2647 [Acetivibrio straminisolvens JCM 21531]